MIKCILCGLDNPSEKARFCIECGTDGLDKGWISEDIDQPPKVSQYVSILSEFYFDAQNEATVEKYSLRIRERLKISYDTHTKVITKLAHQKKSIAHLANFRIEFNENVTDAYVGHDTFLNFRYTNLSEEHLFKISLMWDDPEATERIYLRAQTSNFVKPQGAVTLGASVIFDRMGIKELADIKITITDQLGEMAKFKAESIIFKVGSNEQKITQNIVNHNQISIEGRGVIDASGLGAGKEGLPQSNNQPSWRQLSFSYLHNDNTQNSVGGLTGSDTLPAESNSSGSEILEALSSLQAPRPLNARFEAKSPNVKGHEIHVFFPDIGDFKDVVVIELLVKIGDKIKIDQSLITVESDKAIMEIPSFHSGVVKEIKVRLGDKVNEGTLVLLLEEFNSSHESLSQTDLYFPPVSLYVPTSRRYSRFTLMTEVSAVLPRIMSRSSNWHFLVAGSKSVPKLIIRDLILKGQKFVTQRNTSGRALKSYRDLAAILTSLEVSSLFELDYLEDLLALDGGMGDFLYTALSDFQLDIVAGEGANARSLRLDLHKFCSIFYCADFNKIPAHLLTMFDCCISLDD